MPMQMDTSIGDVDSSTGASDAAPADEIKRLVQQARGGGSVAGMQRKANAAFTRAQGRLSTSTRPTYAPADEHPITGSFDPDAPFVPAEGMSLGDARARGLTDQSGLNDPSSIYYDRSQGGGQTQGALSSFGQQDPRAMAAAYQNLLHSVAMQHGGQPPANGATPSIGGSQSTPPNGAQAGQAGQPNIDPKQAFQNLLHSVAVQHGGTPPSEGGQQPQSTVGTATSGPEFEARSKAYWNIQDKKDAAKPKSSSSNTSSKDDIPSPPRLPTNADKGQIEQFKSEHQAWVDDVKFNQLHKAVVDGGHSNSKQRLEMAAVKAQSAVAQKDLEDAQSKFEKSKGMFTSGDTSLKDAVDKAQSTLDSIKDRRNKLMDEILGTEDKKEDDVQDSSGMITAATEEDIKTLTPGTRFIGPDGKVWIRHGKE